MTSDEKQLLDNLLDSLDRLFDSESAVADIHALLFATSKALALSELGPRIELFVTPLGELVRKRGTEEARRDEALMITNDLRLFLADVLRFPEQKAS